MPRHRFYILLVFRYAGSQLVLPNGTHLVTGMYTGCPPPGYVRNGGIHLFRSDDGYTFTFVSHVARQSDEKGWASPAEGPNEHTVALLPNNNLLAVFRTEAGDGNGRYGPYYSTLSTDIGQTWSTATPLKDTDGNYIGCARPHMVQLDGNITLLAGGRMMMGRDYSRSFSVWMSKVSSASRSSFAANPNTGLPVSVPPHVFCGSREKKGAVH